MQLFLPNKKYLVISIINLFYALNIYFYKMIAYEEKV